jgi:exopolyphosphatase/guanosine-5'-triphosphate,3'-diphosphate pyrophosphatase
MAHVRRAVIDIGTNSIKLLVADVDGAVAQPVLEQSRQTRLGRGFYDTHRLQPEAIEATAKAVSDFVQTARQHSATSVKLIATSAAREAKNVDELASAITGACGLSIEIISGAQEADWVFKGVSTDPVLARIPLLILDAGGGSTEFILGQGNEKHFSASFPLGTVRLLEQCPHGEPPSPSELNRCRGSIRDFLMKEVHPLLDAPLAAEVHGRSRGIQLAGTGGTAAILARVELQIDSYDRARIEGVLIPFERVRWHAEHLWSLPLQARKNIRGLPPDRADVILPGVLIYEAIMDQFGFGQLRVSTRGLRFAAVLEP